MPILGIDEVGRGPLVGPLVVGAVILPENKKELEWVEKLRDSKKLTRKKREELSEIILKEASACGLGWVSAHEIDALGMTAALKLGARRAVEEVQGKHVTFTEVIIDGNLNFLEGTRLEDFTTTVIKGDDKIKEISAASIIAKVARDRYMMEYGARHPEYDFEHNMGYGTKKHLAAINEHGLTPEHRLSFEPCKSISGFERERQARKNTTRVGKKAEMAVAKYLEARGQDILFMNYKNKYSEIDIISTDFPRSKVYFTEVKYRKNTDYGGGLSAIDRKKLEQMKFATRLFLKHERRKHLMFSFFDPALAVATVSGNFQVDDWFPIYDDGLSMNDESTR